MSHLSWYFLRKHKSRRKDFELHEAFFCTKGAFFIKPHALESYGKYKHARWLVLYTPMNIFLAQYTMKGYVKLAVLAGKRKKNIGNLTVEIIW